MVDVFILSAGPFARILQAGEHKSFQRGDFRCGVKGVRQLLLLDLSSLQVQRLAPVGLCATCESAKGAPVVADDKDGMSASESRFESRFVVEVCGDHLDALLRERFRFFAGGVASQATDLVLRMFEEGLDD